MNAKNIVFNDATKHEVSQISNAVSQRNSREILA